MDVWLRIIPESLRYVLSSLSAHILDSSTDKPLRHDLKQLFMGHVKQYDNMRKVKAFLAEYKKEPMFENGFEEFDDAR